MTQPEISLVLPAYNEQDNILNVIETSCQHLEQINRSWELIVVDNCSSDKTAELVQSIVDQRDNVRLIVHDENRYYSGSCQTALNESRGKWIAIMDSDGQFSAADLPLFIEKLQAGANLVFGWRKKRNDPVFRLFSSSVFNTLGKFWLSIPVHDLNVGIRMFDQKVAEATEFRHRLNMANPELYTRVKIAGLNIDEVVVQHFAREHGHVCHDFSKIWKLFWDVNHYLKTLSQELKAAKKSPPHQSVENTEVDARKVA
ncbi:Hypothetical protein PBC10988_7240 [Planctomycetales bacterium 10988]|nr:Hypothetical protein PBC10988_7240 [Planctomycetales bacterium 10988]